MRSLGFMKNNIKLRAMYLCRGGAALHLAVFRDKTEVVQWLLEKKADHTKKTKTGQTPLQLARELKHEQCCTILKSCENLNIIKKQ